MPDIIAKNGFIILMLVLLAAMMIFSSRSRKKMVAQQEEKRRQMEESLVPGVWVRTVVGFWGRYVDADGDVVILETGDGVETYWDRSSIREVGSSPFASESEQTNESDEDHEPEKPILGLNADDSADQGDESPKA